MCVFFLSGRGSWSGFVFWRSGASARPGVFVFFPWMVVLVPAVRCLFVFCFGGSAPLLCLSSSWSLWLAIVLCCRSLLLVFLIWCPGLLPGDVSGLAFESVLLIDALGLLPALGCLLPLVVVIGVCLLAPWDSCPPCGVRLPPLGGCGLGLVFVFRLFGASPRSGVLFFLLVVVVSALGLLPALLRFFSLLVAVMGICPSVLVLCWFRLLGPFFFL